MNVRVLLPAVAVVLAAVPGSPAAATAAGPATGGDCSVTSSVSPVGDDRTLVVLTALPMVIADGADPRTGRVTCAVQHGERHSDPDLVAVTSVTTPGVVALPPTPAEHAASAGWQPTHVCVEVEIDGAGTFYWDNLARVWSADPDTPCYGSIEWEDPDLLGEVVDLADHLVYDVVDPALCPWLAALAPGAGPVRVEPDGDVYVADSFLWDCPPYE